MSFFDQFSKVTKDFGNKAQEMTKDIKGKLEEQQAIARLKAQKAEAEKQIQNTYTAIGQLYYQQHKDDAENEMASQFQIIAAAEERKAQYEQQLKAIKNENTCPSCGAAISKEALYCPNCGAKIERPQSVPQEDAEPTQAADAEESENESETVESESVESELGETADKEVELNEKPAEAEVDSEENPADK